MINSNTSRIQTLENGGGGGGGSTDLGPLEARVDAIDYDVGANTRLILAINGMGGQIQSLYSIADDNSNRIQTLENGGGGDSTDLGPLQTQVNEIDPRVGGNTTSINNNTTRIQTIENGGGGDSTDLGPLEASVSAIDTRVVNIAARIQTLETQAESISTNSGNNRIRLQHLEKVTTEQITQVNTQYTQLDNKVETPETQVEQLDMKSNILANGVKSLLGNMNDVLPRVLSLEQNMTTIFYKSAELPLSQYENGKMLTVFHPMGYDPLRVIMKARDVQSGFVYTVNPGSDYGFNYRYAMGFNTTQSRNTEVAIGSAGLFLMTNSGSRRNVLTGQRQGRFNIYAIMEFVTSPPRNLAQNEIWQSNPYADDSLNF